MLGVQVGVNLEGHVDDQPFPGSGRRLKSTAPAGAIHLHLMSCDVRNHLILFSDVRNHISQQIFCLLTHEAKNCSRMEMRGLMHLMRA